jgi:hypothetical protein
MSLFAWGAALAGGTFAGVALFGVAVGPAPSFQAQTLSPQEFARLHASGRPAAEKWTEIPWETDLTQARERSAKENKPLLMWVMDGHPLGCT